MESTAIKFIGIVLTLESVNLQFVFEYDYDFHFPKGRYSQIGYEYDNDFLFSQERGSQIETEYDYDLHSPQDNSSKIEFEYNYDLPKGRSDTPVWITYTESPEYEEIWNNKGTGGSNTVSIWRSTNIPHGFCSLGDVAHGVYSLPGIRAILVSSKTSLAVHPTSFDRVWTSSGSGADSDCTIYTMKAPSDDYTCLGGVAMRSLSDQPNKNNYCCVRRDLLAPGKLVETYKYYGTGTRTTNNLALWTVKKEPGIPTLPSGNFVPVDGHDKPREGLLLHHNAIRDMPKNIAYMKSFQYEKIWSDHGSGSFQNLSIWRTTNIPNGFCSLGDIALPDSNASPIQATILVSSATLAAVHPSNFTQVWQSWWIPGTSLRQDCTIYRMNAPSGYTCLGGVAMWSLSEQPDKNNYCCILDDLLVPGNPVPVYFDYDIISSSNNLALWTVAVRRDVPGIFAYTMMPYDNYEKQTEGFVLNSKKVIEGTRNYHGYENKHFLERQCPEVKRIMSVPYFIDCKKMCDITPDCTAINFKIHGYEGDDQFCSLLNCGIHPSFPMDDSEFWYSFSLQDIPDDYKYYEGPQQHCYKANEDGCIDIGGQSQKSYVECEKYCDEISHCTGYNINKESKYCNYFYCEDRTIPIRTCKQGSLESWAKKHFEEGYNGPNGDVYGEERGFCYNMYPEIKNEKTYDECRNLCDEEPYCVGFNSNTRNNYKRCEIFYCRRPTIDPYLSTFGWFSWTKRNFIKLKPRLYTELETAQGDSTSDGSKCRFTKIVDAININKCKDLCDIHRLHCKAFYYNEDDGYCTLQTCRSTSPLGIISNLYPQNRKSLAVQHVKEKGWTELNYRDCIKLNKYKVLSNKDLGTCQEICEGEANCRSITYDIISRDCHFSQLGSDSREFKQPCYLEVHDLVYTEKILNVLKCKPGAVYVGGQCLRFSTHRVTWEEARKECWSQDATLAKLNYPLTVLQYTKEQYHYGNNYDRFWTAGRTAGSYLKNKDFKRGPENMLWRYSTCPELGRHRVSLEQCKDMCIQTDKCTAFNWNDGQQATLGCELLKCQFPVPDPNWPFAHDGGWVGYSRIGNWSWMIDRDYSVEPFSEFPWQGWTDSNCDTRYDQPDGTGECLVVNWKGCFDDQSCDTQNTYLLQYICEDNEPNPTLPNPTLPNPTVSEPRTYHFHGNKQFYRYQCKVITAHHLDLKLIRLETEGVNTATWCQRMCDNTPNCTAININNYEYIHDCYLLACGNNPPFPEHIKDYSESYSLKEIEENYDYYGPERDRLYESGKGCVQIQSTYKNKSIVECDHLCDYESSCIGYNIDTNYYDCQLFFCEDPNTLSNGRAIVGWRSYKKPAGYGQPQSYIIYPGAKGYSYHNRQCRRISYPQWPRSPSPFVTCSRLCSVNSHCTAFNYLKGPATGKCDLRACGQTPPAPGLYPVHKEPGWQGYTLEKLVDTPWLQGKRVNQCGPENLLPDGQPAQCNPNGKNPCCGKSGWCGNSAAECNCRTCIDYRNAAKTTPSTDQVSKYYGPYGNTWKLGNGNNCTSLGHSSDNFAYPKATYVECEEQCDENPWCTGFHYHFSEYRCEYVGCYPANLAPNNFDIYVESWSQEKITDPEPAPKCPGPLCTLDRYERPEFDCSRLTKYYCQNNAHVYHTCSECRESYTPPDRADWIPIASA